MPVYTRALDPGLLNEALFVNRKREMRELDDYLQARVRDPDVYQDCSLVTGERGIGKSILTRAALARLKEQLGGHVAFIRVEGSRQPDGFRGLLRDVLNELRTELEGLDKAESERALRTPEQVYRQIDALASLARYARVTAMRVQQTLEKYELSAELRTPKAFGHLLGTRFGVSLEQQDRQSLTLEEEFDDETFRVALCRILAELRQHRQKVVIFVDDLDQVYGVESTRIEQTDAMLKHIKQITDCFLVVNLRDYYVTGETNREYHFVLHLPPLDADALRSIVRARLKTEPEPKRGQLAETLEPCLDALCEHTGNPLALLSWCHWLVTRTSCGLEDLRANLNRFVANHYAWFSDSVPDVAALFKGLAQPIRTRDDLIKELAGGESMLRTLERREILLPLDFHERLFYRLNPLFHFYLAD